MRPPLLAFTPLPPARNGIADYARLLLGGLASHYDCAIACEDWLGEAPPGVPVLDPALAHRRHAPGGRVLHQIGNNPDHGFVLRALRTLPGVVTLHDPGLMWLHQTTGEPLHHQRALMAAAIPPLGAVAARQHRDRDAPAAADHLLFDMAGEVLARARAVIVHSAFARARLRALHGDAATAHVAVVPHPLPPMDPPERGAARARLGLPANGCIVVTAGFATAAKRLDWVAAAVAGAIEAGTDLHWIQAGPERAKEFDLEAAIAAHPALAGRAHRTGWITEAALTDHLAAADIVVNLRFPSTGESSGTLARALACGAACLVSDTGAYAELPRDAVLHIPLAGAVPALAAALQALAAEPTLTARLGAAGRDYARRELALGAVLARTRQVIEVSRDRPVAAPAPPGPLVALALTPGLSAAAIAAALTGRVGRCHLLLEAADADALAAATLGLEGLVPRLLPPGAALRGVRVRRAGLVLALDLGGAA